jgi:hypothetical protein
MASRLEPGDSDAELRMLTERESGRNPTDDSQTAVTPWRAKEVTCAMRACTRAKGGRFPEFPSRCQDSLQLRAFPVSDSFPTYSLGDRGIFDLVTVGILSTSFSIDNEVEIHKSVKIIQ